MANLGQIREDRELVKHLLDGDRAAFQRLFDDHFDSLYRFALTRLDHDEEVAAEVVQATMCTAIEKLDTYRGEAALFTWLCSCCRFEISAHFRRLKRAPVQLDLIEEQPEIRTVLEALSRGQVTPEEDLRITEMRRLVHLTLDHLPPSYGRALEWKYFEGLSVHAIAERLELSPKAAESVLSRAREAFRTGFAALCKGLSGEGYRGLRLATAREGASHV